MAYQGRLLDLKQNVVRISLFFFTIRWNFIYSLLLKLIYVLFFPLIFYTIYTFIQLRTWKMWNVKYYILLSNTTNILLILAEPSTFLVLHSAPRDLSVVNVNGKSFKKPFREESSFQQLYLVLGVSR